MKMVVLAACEGQASRQHYCWLSTLSELTVLQQRKPNGKENIALMIVNYA